MRVSDGVGRWEVDWYSFIVGNRIYALKFLKFSKVCTKVICSNSYDSRRSSSVVRVPVC